MERYLSNGQQLSQGEIEFLLKKIELDTDSNGRELLALDEVSDIYIISGDNQSPILITERKGTMDIYISKDDFLNALTITEEDFTLPNELGTVRIKPLSLSDRADIQRLNTNKDGKLDILEMQTAALLAGLMQPKLTQEDLAALRAGRPALVDAITLRIMETSGMQDDFEKKVGDGS